jgi:hypothetical protein
MIGRLFRHTLNIEAKTNIEVFHFQHCLDLPSDDEFGGFSSESSFSFLCVLADAFR